MKRFDCESRVLSVQSRKMLDFDNLDPSGMAGQLSHERGFRLRPEVSFGCLYHFDAMNL